MANKILANSVNDPSLLFTPPTYSGFQSSKDTYATNSILSNGLVKTGLITAGFFGARSIHNKWLNNNPRYLSDLKSLVKTFEDKTPNYIGRTFGIGERISSYSAATLEQPLFFSKQQLISEGGRLTPTGKGFQRLFGDKFDIASRSNDGLEFIRSSKSSQYLTLKQSPDINVRFVDSKSTLAANAYNLNKPLVDKQIHWSKNESKIGRALENFKAIKHSQMPGKHPGGFADIIEGSEFLPYHVKFDPSKDASILERGVTNLKNLGTRTEVEAFGFAERGQKLLAETIGLGLKQGTYNKLATIPFFAKEGTEGLLNGLLLKRVLPIALGITALKYGDYLTGHHVSNALVDIPLKANVLRAEVTDRLPGARTITDTYENVVPGPQYGPIALPLGGAFIGGLLHYGKVLGVGGGYQAVGNISAEEARFTASKLLPNLKGLKNIKNLDGLKKGLKSVWSSLGTPGKGAALGLAAMIPFIPGMLGSRKTAGELKDIYSGEQDVPIRSGRWWSLGSNPFSGGRITSWRPHWSVLFKSRAREKSLWGSEENYWKNNALIHPLNYLKNPYALENQNYRDRPYPITSPAFSNVPLIGPILAATIGKLVKPVKRMHEDEFDEKDYDMYSTRLNPKGPLVESKFEKDVLRSLSAAGYNTQTQVKSGRYRIDFVVNGDDGKKLAIEADGDSYHGFWNKNADEDRQKELEKAGWDFIRIRSGSFFKDPDQSMNAVFRELHNRGINPTGDVSRDISSGLIGLAPPVPKEEFGLFDALKEEALIASEFIGLPGYVARTLKEKIFPDKDKYQESYLQGSRQMDSLARSYYETNLGEGLGPTDQGTTGYTEPIRRFIQRDPAGIQANDIPNSMPSWLPGEDYLINFRVGDPFTKAEQGFARLPGAGYEAIHPELAGLDPEDYPDINKLAILADVAPYSREFNIFKDKISNTIGNDQESRIRYERILDQARQSRESILQVDKRRFTGDTEKVEGTVKSATTRGIELSEYPGRLFKFSSLGMSAADLSAVVLGKNNNLTRSEVAQEVTNKQYQVQNYIQSKFKAGTKVRATVPLGASENAENISTVFNVGGTNVNRELLDLGYAQYDKRYGGAESGEIFGSVTKALGSFAETASFTVAEYIPSPYHTKFWQERTAYDQYVSQEVVGTRMRRWDRPFDDFASPYLRGALNKLTGVKVMAEATLQRRDLNTLADQLKYLRALHNIAEGEGDEYTRDTRRTNIGANLLASPIFVASTIPDRDKRYFQSFLSETDSEKRLSILEVASPEMAKTLQAQWAAADARIQTANGKDSGLVQEQGRLVTKENLEEYSKATTQLGYGDYLRSKEISNFFARTGFNLPDEGESELFSNNLDYEDVKLKIIQNEGYDAHDFNIFDDRAAMLWRKPYIDGAVSALTSGDNSRSAEQIRRSIEQLMINANNKNPKVNVVNQASHVDKNNVKINISVDEQERLLKDIRRNPEDYQEQ